MYEFIKYLLFTNLTLFVFSLALCNAQEAKNRLKLPRGPVVYSDYENAELIEIGVKLCRLDRHPEAVEASREALRRDLSDAQAASAKHVMARACDAIPSRGPQAKDAYLRIIREHPTYDKLPEIAYRLAELNVCIIKKGTEPDPSKGMEYLKLVIKREPLEIEGKPNLTYLSLKAHMMLGILQMFQGASEEAKKCFKAIYDCDVNQVVPLAHEKFKDDKEK